MAETAGDEEIVWLDLPDPGPGARMAEETRTRIATACKRAARGDARCLVVAAEDAALAADDPDPLGGGSAEEAGERARGELAPLIGALHRLPVPVLVGATGPVTGAGLAVLMTADLRVGTVDGRFGAGPSAALGSGLSWLLARRAPRAVPLLLEDADGRRAYEMGVLTHPPAARGDVRDTLSDLAHGLAARSRAHASALRRSLSCARERPFEESADFDGYLVETLFDA